jgi:hypothetical protein
MSTATLRPTQGTAVSRTTRKPRATTASLIASEFTKYETLPDGSIWDEVRLPAPIELHPATEGQTTPSPVILFLIAFVITSVLIKLSIDLILIAAKITKKIAHQIAAFAATQMGGGGSIDYRVYQAIFD